MNTPHKQLTMKNIAIFASGSGTNAENIILYFKHKNIAKVKIILCNNSKAKVIERAKNLDVDCVVFTKDELLNSNKIIDILRQYSIDYIVLAGFMLLVPDSITNLYKDNIINIHPSLLPKYGGKGMFGDNVHKAVIEAKDKVSGITIHCVNDKFDDGEPIFTTEVEVSDSDTAESLAAKIHTLEYKYFPEVIEREILKML